MVSLHQNGACQSHRAIIFLVGLGESASDLTKRVVCKKTVTGSSQMRSRPALTYKSYHQILPPT